LIDILNRGILMAGRTDKTLTDPLDIYLVKINFMNFNITSMKISFIYIEAERFKFQSKRLVFMHSYHR
jgi:hypothetical protein